jgi:hypothetical protein
MNEQDKFEDSLPKLHASTILEIGRLGWLVVVGVCVLALALPEALLREYSPKVDIRSGPAGDDSVRPLKPEIDEPSRSTAPPEPKGEPARKQSVVPAREASPPVPVPAVPAPEDVILSTPPQPADVEQRPPLEVAVAQPPGVMDPRQRPPGAPIETSPITTASIEVAPIAVAPVEAIPWR